MLGRGPGAEGPNDQRDPTLPADQQALVTALKATGKPVIVVLIDDRPDALGTINDTPVPGQPDVRADALLAAWRPGTEGGDGVADLLYGKVNPSGRLTVSWPARATDQPNTYRYLTLPTTYNGNGPVYQPAFPFGFGLSYSTTATAVTRVSAANGSVTVRLSVSNTGGPAGGVSVPVYVSQPVSQVLVPAKRLVGFTRVTVPAGGTVTARVTFPTSVLGVVPGDVNGSGPLTVEPGQYVFSTGTVGEAVPAATATNSLTL